MPNILNSPFLGPFSELFEKRLLNSDLSVCLFVPPSLWNNSTYTRRIFMNFHMWVCFGIRTIQLNIHKNRTGIKGTLDKVQYTFLIISRSIYLRIKNVSHEICGENQNTHFTFNDSF